MDKIILATKDVQALLQWRDEHNDLVRKAPAPFKAIEMQFPQTKIRIKAFREADELILYVNKHGKSQGHFEYLLLPSGLCVMKRNKSALRPDELQDCLTVYMSLMALVAYTENGNDVEDSTSSVTTFASGTSATNVNKSKHIKKGVNVTYLLSRANEVKRQVAMRERRSPKYAYSVRGHFRHYKSGKVVWIEQHIRGDKEKKSKVYKLGKGLEENS